jgi:hypothetical protein
MMKVKFYISRDKVPLKGGSKTHLGWTLLCKSWSLSPCTRVCMKPRTRNLAPRVLHQKYLAKLKFDFLELKTYCAFPIWNFYFSMGSSVLKSRLRTCFNKFTKQSATRGNKLSRNSIYCLADFKKSVQCTSRVDSRHICKICS